MWKTIVVSGLLALVLACGRDPNAVPECRPASEQLMTALSAGINDGATIENVHTVTSRAYTNVWFVGARIIDSASPDTNPIGVWGVDDLEQPEFIWWANDTARRYSSWGDEQYYDAATDGIGVVRSCAARDPE